MRSWTAILAVAITLSATSAHAQLQDLKSVDRLNRRLAGCIVDYTNNHGCDRRVYSHILGRPRDLYIYLPPGYSPDRAYPLVIYMHMAAVDEHEFLGSNVVNALDDMIRTGQFPPAVFAIPDGIISGENRVGEPHSLFINGRCGRFEDHVLQEVVPFVISRYSIRPEREARALFGASAGGLGAASIGLRHPDLFGAVATMAAPLNLRYTTCNNNTLENFSPATFRWKTTYDPDEIVGKFYFGFDKVPARKYISPVFGDDPATVPGRIAAINPADLLFTAHPQPGRPFMYVNYAGRDNWNFDAEAQSFLWLAGQVGFPVDSHLDPRARHSLIYFRSNHTPALCWLATHLAPPTASLAPRPPTVIAE
jgi:hypothetical protein